MHGSGLEPFLGLMHVIRALLCQPKSGLAAAFNTQPRFNTQGHLRGNGGAAIEQAGQRHAGHIQLLCSFGHSQAQRWQYVIAQCQAGVRGVNIRAMANILVVVLIVKQHSVGTFKHDGLAVGASEAVDPIVNFSWKCVRGVTNEAVL